MDRGTARWFDGDPMTWIALAFLALYGSAVIVLPFVLWDVWRTRHLPKGRAARDALLRDRREAKARETGDEDG